MPAATSVAIDYTYDNLYRLTGADYSNGDFYHYAYDAVGNRLSVTTANETTTYTYDPANRLTAINSQTVTWDDNGGKAPLRWRSLPPIRGNMLSDGTTTYQFNTANKLIGLTKGTSSIVYKYSGLGDRLQQIAGGVTTNYTLDINSGLTQVLQDGNQLPQYPFDRQSVSTRSPYSLL